MSDESDEFLAGFFVGFLICALFAVITGCTLDLLDHSDTFVYRTNDQVTVGSTDYHIREFVSEDGLPCAVLLSSGGTVVGWTCQWEAQ
jgi:hypothetical protein